jgi:ABC-type spermidine/putrescine transport system permease subunit II
MSAIVEPVDLAEEGRQIATVHERHIVRQSRWYLALLRYAVLLLALAFFLFPIFWVAVTSIKFPGDYMHRPPVFIPDDPTLNHYRNVMDLRGNAALKNSAIIATTATALSLLIGTLAAYSLAALATDDAAGRAGRALFPHAARHWYVERGQVERCGRD